MTSRDDGGGAREGTGSPRHCLGHKQTSKEAGHFLQECQAPGPSLRLRGGGSPDIESEAEKSQTENLIFFPFGAER